MRKMRLAPKLIVLACVALLGVATALYLKSPGLGDAGKDVRAKYLPGGEFSLMHGDKPFSLSSLHGIPVILYFGYTFCPDVCPVGLAVIRDALKQDTDFDKVAVLFVTVDPDRDTAQRLEEYTSFFDPRIIPLRGNVADIQSVGKAYGTYFMASKQNTEGNYTVDHTAYFYLIDSSGELVRVLDHNTDASALAAALRPLL